MAQKFDSTAHERGTTATIPRQYYIPKKSEAYWRDVVDEGIGRAGLPNKTRRQGILNLLEGVARKNATIRLGLQKMLAHDPSASGIVALRKDLISRLAIGETAPGGRELQGAAFPRLAGYGEPTAEPSSDYKAYMDEIKRRISAGKVPSHWDSSLPADAFTGSPVVAYSVEETIEDKIGPESALAYDHLTPRQLDALKIPAGYQPAHARGILSLGHELGHIGAKEVYGGMGRYLEKLLKNLRHPLSNMKPPPLFTQQERMAAASLIREDEGEEMLMRAFDAAHRTPHSRAYMGEFEGEIERRAHKRYPNPLRHPIQSAAEKFLRDQYAGRELYPQLPRQHR
jgi:hypothetical protein